MAASFVSRQSRGTYSATIGTTPGDSFKFNQLSECEIDGRFVHLRKIGFRNKLTPTFSGEPGVPGQNSVVKKIRLGSGNELLLNAGYNALRAFERMEKGGQTQMEGIANTSTNPRFFTRTWHAGPANAAKIEDYDIPLAMLQDASLEWDYAPNVAALQGTVTVATNVLQLEFQLILKDHINIPPFLQRLEEAAGSGELISKRALYHFLAYANSLNYDAIAANDYGSFIVGTGSFNPVQQVASEVLMDQYRSLWDRGGEVGSVQGEQEDDTYDVNERRASLASPTALAAQLADLQIVLAGGPLQKLTKLICNVSGNLVASWDGTQTSNANYRLMTRTLLASDDYYANALAKCEAVLGKTFNAAGVKVPTIDKAPIGNHPYINYFPRRYKRA